MIGSEAEQNNEDQTERQSLDFGLFLLLCRDVAANRRQDTPVGDEHGRPGRQESQKRPVEVHPRHPVLHGILFETECVIEAILEELIVEQRCRVGHDLNDPHDGADQDSCQDIQKERSLRYLSHVIFKGSQILHLGTCFDPSNLGEAQRVRHSQVPVQWDAAEKCDAHVDVGVEDEAEEFAALLTVDPVVMLKKVVDPQGKGGDVEQVCHRQVDQVHAQLVALPHLVWQCRGEKKMS